MPAAESAHIAVRLKRSQSRDSCFGVKAVPFHTFYASTDTPITAIVSGKWPRKCDIGSTFLPALFIHRRRFACRTCSAGLRAGSKTVLARTPSCRDHSKDLIRLADQETSLHQGDVPRLLSEVKTAAHGNANFIFTVELDTHLQPWGPPDSGVFHRFNAAVSPQSVGVPTSELRTLSHTTALNANGSSRTSARPSNLVCGARSIMSNRIPSVVKRVAKANPVRRR